MDLFDRPGEVHMLFDNLALYIEKFVASIQTKTGTSSISVNRIVRHFNKSLFLHSECSHTMISSQDYETFLMPYDSKWSTHYRPFGIHYCGDDPHRFGELFAKLPSLDFLDVGWGGDIKKLRKFLPNTFLNIRLSPVEIRNQSLFEIESTIERLVKDSGNPYLTGVCCINMDSDVPEQSITTVFKTVAKLRERFSLK